MATTRNKRRALGAAAPDLENLETYAAAAARTRKNRTASQGDEHNNAREGSAELDIPGTFAPSPVNVDRGPSEPSTDKREAEAHISIEMGERTDEEKSESCPPGESSDEVTSPRVASTGNQPCPTGSTPEPGTGAAEYSSEWDCEADLGYPPSIDGDVSSKTGDNQSTTPFRSPSRASRVITSHSTVRIEGAKYFPANVLRISNKHIEDITEDCEIEHKSDETLKQSKKPKRKSNAHQRAEDIAFLRAVIKDNKRRKTLEKALPDIIPNNKSLLVEMRDALRESSGDEYGYETSEWENLPESPIAGPSGTQGRVDTPLPSEREGPSYFAKGKWVSNKVHDEREAYKTNRKRAKESDRSTQSEGREKSSAKRKKPRPSMGLTVDNLRPAQSAQRTAVLATEKSNLKQSVAALPAGGYLANRMRSKMVKPDMSRSQSSVKHSRKDSTTSSNESTSSEDSSSSGPSSDSNSSESHSSPSSSSSDSNRQIVMSQNRKRKNANNRDKYREKVRKFRKKAHKARRAKIKLIEPKLYLGQSDYDDFELWNYEVDLWLKDSGYKGRKAVRYLGSLLGGKAAQWYMDHVAPDPQAYTPDMVKMGLFGYCFPPDMKSKLRDEFKHMRQGPKRFADYLRELKRYQRRIPDITDKQLCIKLWDTVHTYIKVKWVETGMNAEESELTVLSEAAERFEAAEEVKRELEIRRDTMSRPRHGTFRFRPERHAEGRVLMLDPSRRPNLGPSQQNNAGGGTEPPRPAPTQTPRQLEARSRNDQPKMSKEERNELRAAGKCFLCKEPGHTFKDCPTRNTAKPSGLFSSALQYEHIEQLRKEREQTYLSVASIQLSPESPPRPPNSTSSITSYSALEFTPGGSLLNEILDQITPYSQIVVAESDRLRIVNDETSIEMSYKDIASQVRDNYLEREQRQRIIVNANNQGMPAISEVDEDKWETDEWSTSEEESVPEQTAGPSTHHIQLNAVRTSGKKKAEPVTRTVERNAAKRKDVARKLPKPLVVEATIDGHKVRALIDTGSLGDFISTTVVDQLKIKREELAKPIGLQMAVTGSRSSINFSVSARVGYQGIDCMRRFDVINIDNYDLILGTPFLYQHKIIIGLNPPTVSVGSKVPLPIDGETAMAIESLAAELYNKRIEEHREVPRQYESDLCKTMAETQQPTKSTLAKCVTAFELLGSIIGRYDEDSSFKHILAEPERYRNYKTINGALYLERDDSLLLCIPNVKIGARPVCEVVITHAHSIMAYLGARKTLSWMRTQVWWKTMVRDVIDHCQSCHTCAANKSSSQSPMGLLHPMPMPSYSWQSIGIDFVGPLPESETHYGKFDMIMTVIDNLTRMVHLIPTRQNYKAKDTAEVIFEHVYKLHGIPERIVSDRDSLFTSTFWTRLAQLTKTELRMSSAYHPQTDGMTERAQRTYMGILGACAGSKQAEWASHLAAIEFAINSARSEATGLSPFYLNYGRTPSPMIHNTNTKFPGVKEHIERIKLAIMIAHDAILDARVKMTRQANQHRRPAEFQIGDLVYVSTKNVRMPKGFAWKLAPKFVGPYKITREITQGATYEVELPRDLKARGIRPVFHASLLRIHVPIDDRRFPGRDYSQIASLGDAPQEWAVDRITSHKGKGRKAIFELLWKSGDRTWEPYQTVRHLEALDAYCEAQGVKQASKLPGDSVTRIDESEPEEIRVSRLWLENEKERVEIDDQEDSQNSPFTFTSYSLWSHRT